MCSAAWSSGLSSEKICDLKIVGAGTIMYVMLHIFKLIGRYFVHKTRLVGFFYAYAVALESTVSLLLFSKDDVLLLSE